MKTFYPFFVTIYVKYRNVSILFLKRLYNCNKGPRTFYMNKVALVKLQKCVRSFNDAGLSF